MKERMKKLAALSMSAVMVASLAACGGDANNDGSSESGSTSTENSTSVESSTPADNTGDVVKEETYDFGGVTVKGFGGDWGRLTDESDLVAQEAKAFVEKKYNIKLEKASFEGHDGVNDAEIIINSVSAGDPATHIINLNPESMVSLYQNDMLVDITDMIDELQIGSIYTDAMTWKGRCYGISYDNLGDAWVLVYDRQYLKEIGMEKTPTEMFMEGKWSYADFEAYCADMKAKLPEDKYPIGCYPLHWGVMAAGANGSTMVDAAGNITFDDDANIEALEFYQKLENENLAFPMYANDDFTDYGLAYALTDERIVMKRAEAWQLGGIDYDYGIVFWPWGSNVTCDGDYTKLSSNYKVTTTYWAGDGVIKAAVDKTGIPGDVLTKIAYDYRDQLESKEWMHDAWLAEQSGNNTVIGKDAGEVRSFYDEKDIELYDWAHSRFQIDMAWPMNSAGYTDTWESTEKILMQYKDARSTMESYKNEALAALKDAGF